MWVALGTIIGGRLGYVLFYDLGFYFNNLSLIVLDIRKGGMSFHGGMLGVIVSSYVFSKEKLKLFENYRFNILCSPNRRFFGRITNFINSELWGKRHCLGSSISQWRSLSQTSLKFTKLY